LQKLIGGLDKGGVERNGRRLCVTRAMRGM
jgi:hypothetical protein